MQFSIRNKQTKEAAESKESNEAVSKEAIFSLHSSDPESTVELGIEKYDLLRKCLINKAIIT